MYILNPINNQLHSIQIDGYALISVYVYSTMTQGKLKYFTGLSPVYRFLPSSILWCTLIHLQINFHSNPPSPLFCGTLNISYRNI